MAVISEELERVWQWQAANVEKMGTPEYRRGTLAAALLADLERHDTPARRAAVALQLEAIGAMSDDEVMKL